MPHTNNPAAAARKASRAGKKPKFLQRVKKSKGNAFATPALDAEGNPIPVALDAEGNPVPVTPAVDANGKPIPVVPSAELSLANSTAIADPETRAQKAALITEYHALEKQLASPALTDPTERKKLLARQKALGGLKAYQAASVHGGDKKRGGESGKWCVQQLKELKVGVDKGKAKEKVEPIINADGTKTWPPRKEREKVSSAVHFSESSTDPSLSRSFVYSTLGRFRERAVRHGSRLRLARADLGPLIQTPTGHGSPLPAST